MHCSRLTGKFGAHSNVQSFHKCIFCVIACASPSSVKNCYETDKPSVSPTQMSAEYDKCKGNFRPITCQNLKLNTKLTTTGKLCLVYHMLSLWRLVKGKLT